MAKVSIPGSIGEWEGVDEALVAAAFKRGNASAGTQADKDKNIAPLSALKKFVKPCSEAAFKELDIAVFAKYTKDTAKKMPMKVFTSKALFLAMCKDKEETAIDLAKKIAAQEKGKQEEGPKKADKGVTGRLTDTSKYTGAHKERFDKDGKGKGADGRTDAVSSSGYVGGYKGAGTFDKK